MRRTSKLLVFFAMVLALGAITFVPARAWGDDAKAKAQTLFERGITAYKDGRFKDAIDSFLDAHSVYPSPTLSFNAARAYEQMGDNAGALRFYREYLRQSPTASDRARVLERVADMEKKLEARGVQQVTVLSNVVGATVVLDGKPVGVTPWTGEIAPGKHDVKLRRDGYEEAKGDFDLTPQHALDFQLDMEAGSSAPTPTGDTKKEADPTKPDRDQGTAKKGISPWTFVAFGVGVAALGGAVVFEQLRKGSEDDVKTEETQLARHQAYDSMKNQQTAARVLTGVGAAAILAGGVLLYFDLSSGAAGEKKSARAVGVGCDTSTCAATFAGRF